MFVNPCCGSPPFPEWRKSRLETLVYTPTWGGELTLDRAQAQRALRHVIFSRYQARC